MRDVETLSRQCVRCGRCCERWGWSLAGSVEDLTLWLTLGREDIVGHVWVVFGDGRRIAGDRISPEDIPNIVSVRLWRGNDGRGVKACPFFGRETDGRASCRIQSCKPRVCREFMPWDAVTIDFFGSCPACPDRSP